MLIKIFVISRDISGGPLQFLVCSDASSTDLCEHRFWTVGIRYRREIGPRFGAGLEPLKYVQSWYERGFMRRDPAARCARDGSSGGRKGKCCVIF